MNTYRWQGGHQTTADNIISEPQQRKHATLAAQEFAVSVREGQKSVAQ
ncbi:hypothetical protein ABNT96_27225 [Klebsiella pneumoniae]